MLNDPTVSLEHYAFKRVLEAEESVSHLVVTPHHTCFWPQVKVSKGIREVHSAHCSLASRLVVICSGLVGLQPEPE